MSDSATFPLVVISKLMSRPTLAPVLLQRLPTVELDWDQRQRSRFDCSDSAGRRLGVFLPRGSVVRGGDVLVSEGGEMFRVQAQPQPLLKVTACPAHGSPFDVLRAAYHLGNRHVPLELHADHLKLEPDPVLAEMLRGLHLIVTEVSEGFEPEGGAYGTGALMSHAHPHTHGHAHAPDHAHGPGCDHDHGHP